MSTIQKPPAGASVSTANVTTSSAATGVTGASTSPPAAGATTTSAPGSPAPAPAVTDTPTPATAAPLEPAVPAPPPVEVVPIVRPEGQKDRFTANQVSGSLETFVQGSPQPAQPVSSLVPKLDAVTRPADVPTRFEADFALIQDQVTGGKGLDASDKGRRAMEYFAAYAERFVEVAAKTKKVPGGPNDPRAAPEVERTAAADKARLEPRDELAALIDGLSEAAERAERPGGRANLRAPPVERGDPAAKQTADGNTRQPFSLFGGELGQGGGVEAQRERFLNILRGLGFTEIHDQASGQDAVALAAQMLEAETPADARAQLKAANLTAKDFPPPATRSELAQNGERLPVVSAETLRELTEQSLAARSSKAAAAAEAVTATRMTEREGAHRQVELHGAEPPRPTGLAPGPLLSPKITSHEAGWSFQRHRSPEGRLGPMMLWNVLHRFRAPDEESATTESAWSKIAVGAMLILLLTSVLVVALMNV